MKAIIIVLAISFVAVLGGVTEEQKEKARAAKAKCITETGVDPTVIKDAQEKKEFPEDEKAACFAECFLKEMKIMKDDGEIDWDLIRAKVPSDVSQEQIDQLYNACKDTTGTGCQKAYNMLKCYVNNKTFHLFT